MFPDIHFGEAIYWKAFQQLRSYAREGMSGPGMPSFGDVLSYGKDYLSFKGGHLEFFIDTLTIAFDVFNSKVADMLEKKRSANDAGLHGQHNQPGKNVRSHKARR